MLFEFRNTGTHPEDLADGKPVGVGEAVKLTKEQLREPTTQRLVAEGTLIPIGEKSEHEAKLAKNRHENATADEPELEDEGGDSK